MTSFIPQMPPGDDLDPVLASLLQLSPGGLVAFDLQGRVRFLSQAFERMTQLDGAQLLGLDVGGFWDALSTRCVPQSRLGDVASVRRNLAQPANLRRCLVELKKPLGRVLLVSQHLDSNGVLDRVLCFRDVTRETEIDRRKSEFISTAAHELRTPLASIYGFAELLMTQEVDAATRHEFTGIIFQQAQSMANLLDEMLDLARIEVRRQSDFVLERLQVGLLVREVLDTFRPPPGRQPVQVGGPAEDLWVCVDRQKFSRVLLNLLSNAFKYSPGGGSVQIHLVRAATPAMAVKSAPVPMPEVEIQVIDHGLGMTPAQLERTFERFYRAHPGAKIPGTGLGLAIVKEIMTLLDGRVEIRSEAGQGTCVSLFLPLA